MTHASSTEALIARLAAESQPTARFSTVRMTVAMAGTALLGLTLQMTLSGPRADLAASLADPVTLAKPLLPLMALLIVWPQVARVGRPGARLNIWPLALPMTLALVLACWALFQTPGDRLMNEWLGHSAKNCMIAVLALSAAPLIAGIWMMRRGASTRPVLAGALIGLAAGAGAATGYALSCTEDSPLFYVFWYGAAIVLSSVAGAVAGHKRLRW
ncbi:NrsF family protein [Paracoccus sp. Ld10]|uniref:NrsF family protein n=1 Tax=Paracoccus sp. Ld10 TaxID=649158 RepID=UPI00386EE073